MEIKKLRHFRAVVEAGGLSKAAALLHLTPGALSKSIRQLEVEAGNALFHRTARKLLLTDRGTKLYHASEALLAEYARMLRTLDEPSQASGESVLRIASFEVFTTHTLAAVVADGLQQIPLRVLELPVRRISEAVAEREADLGITYAPYPHRGVAFERIGVAKFRIFARKGSFAKTPFSELPFAVPTTAVDGSTAGLLGIDGWPYEQIERLVRYELTSLESALALARDGRCVVFIPSFLAAVYNDTRPRGQALVEISAPKRMRTIEHAVYSVMREGEIDDERVRRFVKHLEAVINRS